MIRPSRSSSCSGLRTSTTSAPSRRSIEACSRKFPCTARTPIFNGSATSSILVSPSVQERHPHLKSLHPRASRNLPPDPPSSAPQDEQTEGTAALALPGRLLCAEGATGREQGRRSGHTHRDQTRPRRRRRTVDPPS